MPPSRRRWSGARRRASRAGGRDRPGEVEGDVAGIAGPAGAAEAFVHESAAAAERLDDDADGIVAAGQDVARLQVSDVAGIAAADALQQHAVGPVAAGLDRAGEREVDRPAGAGAGIADELAVDEAA